MASDRSFHGPGCWIVSAIAGVLAGLFLTWVIPPTYSAGLPVVPLWLVAPFCLLLASIALMPFIHARFWHHHYPDFSFALGGLVAGYYLFGFAQKAAGGTAYGPHEVFHALAEYYAFIALVGGLFVVSGGILVDLRGRGGPAMNGVLLAIGAVLANIVGTTGASMLLIRPFMRINSGRLTPIHVVFFIFIVSNCGGSMTPIGDPPLYLGFIKGVPFFWTLVNMWYDWLFVVGVLIGAFLIYDARISKRGVDTMSPLPTMSEASQLAAEEIESKPGLRIRGHVGLICLVLMIAGVFIDPALKRFAGIEGYHAGATFQLLVAVVSYLLAPRDILAANDFSFVPVKEVALLFLGIFVTMLPALAYLGEHGQQLGIKTPTAFYFGTGVLSAVLDNAPTYVNFLQIAFGPTPINAGTVATFLATPDGRLTLNAISTGAVFFGAMTYIGNGPNFMVKAIAETAGVTMPSFFGYLGYAAAVLLPILVVHWAIFIR